MRVTREPLAAIPVARLTVTEPGATPHHEGECVGYYCDECGQLDETLRQLWHRADCPLAGEHGRSVYDSPDPAFDPGPTPEFDPAHPVYVITAAETEGRGGLCEGEVLGFRCACGNADETLTEMRHDEDCPLAGRHSHVATTGRTGAGARVATDGGQ